MALLCFDPLCLPLLAHSVETSRFLQKPRDRYPQKVQNLYHHCVSSAEGARHLTNSKQLRALARTADHVQSNCSNQLYGKVKRKAPRGIHGWNMTSRDQSWHEHGFYLFFFFFKHPLHEGESGLANLAGGKDVSLALGFQVLLFGINFERHTLGEGESLTAGA